MSATGGTQATSIPTRRKPELLGQTVVIIGGSAGIGLETARRARLEGAEVVLTGRNAERLTQAAQHVVTVAPLEPRRNDRTSPRPAVFLVQ
jgi:short-subunit dehydrogenase involved in D-alanine esterification of teichoic acids